MRKVFLAVFFFAAVLAVLPFNNYTAAELEEEMILYLGETEIISVSNPTRIVIGNPSILDVGEVTKNEMALIPKAIGKTTLVFWDNFGEQSYQIKVFAEDAREVKRRVDNLLAKINLPEVYTYLEEGEGKVLLLGRLKSAQDRERMAMALGGLKDKTVDLIEFREEEAVVEIEVQVLELTKDATTTLGFTWPSNVTVSEVGSVGLSSARWADLFKVINFKRSEAFSVTLDALVQEGKARVLSRPRLACQSGKEAELLVGGEKPIFTTSVAATTGAEGTNVEYKEYGIKLKIRPTVVEQKRVKLGLNVEVSDVGTAETIGATTAPTAKAYPLTKRSASTELFVNDGQTLAIGGLIKQKGEEEIRKVPFLGDIPILGLLFQKKVSKTGGGYGEKGDTELFITLTPKITGEMKEPQEITIEESAEEKAGVPSAAKSKSVSTGPNQEKADEIAFLPAGEISKDPIAGYAGIVQRRILEKLSYPAPAKEAGLQGKVKLSMRLAYNGELLEANVKDSSGYKILDDNAVSVAREISLYPPFPPSVEQEEIWLDIPISYKSD